jgi:hypothetical protein
MSALWLAFALFLITVVIVGWAAFRGGSKHGSIHGLKLLFEKIELHLRIHILTTQTSDFQTKFGDFFMLPDDSIFKVRGNLFQGIRIADFGHLRHAGFSQ